MPIPSWLFAHSPQKYAYDEFGVAVEAIETGSEYVPTKVPR